MTKNMNFESFPHGIDPIFLEPEFRNTRKMPALFTIDRVKHVAINEVNPASAWVFEEPSTVTQKIDGTGVVVDRENRIFLRRTVKAGKNIPENFRLAEFDSFTGHGFGIEPVENSPMKKFMMEALEGFDGILEHGTFELVGPRISGNPLGHEKHTLIPHANMEVPNIPDMRTIHAHEAFEILRPIFADFKERGIEGVVWAGSGNRRVKLRVNDFFGDPNRM